LIVSIAKIRISRMVKPVPHPIKAMQKPVDSIPGATAFQRKYLGTTVSGLSGILPYNKRFG
jgi:hypothetical protein